ncbi:MAG: hypothetical protein SVP26_09860 [Chloroflexota bacterium]|nr:hypothetical protein [Chloroflexota bacterium]
MRKPIFMATMVATGATGILVWYLAPGPRMWALAFFLGFFIIAGLVYMLMAPIELPEIGPRYAGSAGGVVLTAFNIGAFVGLPFMFTPIWVASGANMSAWFLVIMCVLTGALGIGMRELGRKAREKEAARASAEASAS